MFKLDLEKAEEPEIKLPKSAGSSKKAREFQKNIYFCFIDYAKAFDCVDYNKRWKILRDGNTRPPDLPLEKTNMQVRKQQLELDMEQQTGSKGCILSPCLFNFYAEYIMRNAGLEEA